MSRLLIALLMTAGIAVTGCSTPQRNVSQAAPVRATMPITKDAYDVALRNAETQAKIDKDACASRGGNAKDICLAEANGREKIAKAEAEAAYRNTANTREELRVARAEATYNVAKEKCDDFAGNTKDVCVKEAKAALVKGKADANVDRVVADTRQDAAAKQSDARKDANVDKRDADYKVAIEKCDALAGAAKDSCVGNAKTQFGKS